MKARFSPVPFAFCMPWGARGFERGSVHGERCWFCRRDVAAEEGSRGKTVACIYCGFALKLIPEKEIEP